MFLRLRLAQWLVCTPFQGSLPSQVISKTIMKMVQTASLHCTDALG